MNTYARLPVAFSHGQGSRITDTEGREYLDALSGIAVSTLGHAHPKLVAAIAAQAGRVLHTSNLYGIPGQDQLADKLAASRECRKFSFAIRVAKRMRRQSS
jgi:acetylornithine aminotransferase